MYERNERGQRDSGGEEKVQQSGRKRGKIQRRKQRTRTVKENENKWKKLK